METNQLANNNTASTGVPIWLKKALYSVIGKNVYLRLKQFREKRLFYANFQAGVYKEPEQYFLKNIVSGGVCCLDIGANKGDYTFLVSQLVKPDGQVYAFEPVQSAFLKLRHHYDYLKPGNVRLFNYAAANYVGEIEMSIPIEKNDVGIETFRRF